MLAIRQSILFKFGAREVVLDLVILTLVVVLLLRVLVGRLSHEPPLGTLIEHWLDEAMVRAEDADWLAARRVLDLGRVHIDVLLLLFAGIVRFLAALLL